MCKGVAPVVTGLVMTVTSLRTAAIFIALWNFFSVFVEYGLLAQVYRLVPQLAVKLDASDNGQCRNSTLFSMPLFSLLLLFTVFTKLHIYV